MSAVVNEVPSVAPAPSRIGPVLLAAALVPIVAALVASAMLAVDYVRPVPVFCSEGGGCAALRHTALAMLFGIPMPLLGLLAYVVLGVTVLLPGPRGRAVYLVLALVAGLTGLMLLFAQAHYGHICPYCVVADTSGLVSALVAVARLWLTPPPTPASPILTFAGAGSFGVAVVVPFVLGFRASPVPQSIRDELARTPAGDVMVIDFVDFECPFCRMTNAELEPVLEQHRERVRLVRHQVPLRMHPHAMDAARASCCGEQLGKGDAMASALFTAPVDDLTPEGCEKLAQSLGLSLEDYRRCVADPATDRSIEADRALFQATGGYALPTIWIGDTPLVGSQPREALANVLEGKLGRPSGT
jgi:uncharacterized membrane protein/predicted DsbA family dithiol-disulfide isomerase